MLQRKVLASLVVLSALTAGACATFRDPVPDRANRPASFEPGVPHVAMEAVPYWTPTDQGVAVFLTGSYASLVFMEDEGGYQAPVEVLVRVLTRRRQQLAVEDSWTDTVRAPTFEATQSFSRWRWEQRVPTPPGSYVVEVDVRALEGGGSASRSQRVDVPSPEREEMAMSDVRLTVRRDTVPFAPFVGAHLPAGYDSLRAVVDMLHPVDGTKVTMELLRFPSDTSRAVAPYYFSPAGWTLPRIGVAYDQPELLQQTNRRLQDPVESIRIVFSLPTLEPGTYRTIVTSEEPSGKVSTASREFAVMPEAFPRVATLDEMVQALSYIARPREMEHILEAPDSWERRERFDAFWGKLIPNRQEAANVMKQYYARVEEANVLFSNYKEGWKTDRGMTYVVLGMPQYREIQPLREIWHYSYGRRMQPDYIFDRITVADLNPMYDHFVMKRAPSYEQPWERAVERWRDGEVR